MDNSAFGIPEQVLTTLRILNLDLDNLKWMLTQNKQGVLLKLVWRNQPQLAHSDPKPRPIIANVVDRGDCDGAKLHFAMKTNEADQKQGKRKTSACCLDYCQRKGKS